jgi:hypothetical protein
MQVWRELKLFLHLSAATTSMFINLQVQIVFCLNYNKMKENWIT